MYRDDQLQIIELSAVLKTYIYPVGWIVFGSFLIFYSVAYSQLRCLKLLIWKRRVAVCRIKGIGTCPPVAHPWFK